MRCEQTESRLNELLDNRTRIDGDQELTEHLLDCIPCAELADAYAAMQNLEGPAAPQIDVASRVVSDLAQATTLKSWDRWLPHWAVAAAVLIAATTYSMVERDPTPQPIAPSFVGTPPAVAPEIDHEAERLAMQRQLEERLDGRMWQATGRTLATVPLLVLVGDDTNPGTEIPATDEGGWQLFDSLPISWPESETAPLNPGGESRLHSTTSRSLVV